MPLLDASYQLIGGVPLLACHCWLPLLGAIAGVPLLGAIAGVPLLGAIAGVPLLGAIARRIDQSVTPFSAAPFCTLITNKLACAIWGLC